MKADILDSADLPPVWLAGFLALGWALSRLVSFHIMGSEYVGLLAIAMGVFLMLAALAQMAMKRTTFIPRRDARHLVTGGIFALSRNPIYLADALILSGALIYWQVAFLLWLVPLFAVLITRRFIRGEEAHLHARFGAAYDAYCQDTRRWL